MTQTKKKPSIYNLRKQVWVQNLNGRNKNIFSNGYVIGHLKKDKDGFWRGELASGEVITNNSITKDDKKCLDEFLKEKEKRRQKRLRTPLPLQTSKTVKIIRNANGKENGRVEVVEKQFKKHKVGAVGLKGCGGDMSINEAQELVDALNTAILRTQKVFLP